MDNAIKIQLPITVSYAALEDVLRKQVVGEFIPKPEEGSDTTPYAQILDVGIAKSSTGPFDVVLNVRIKILRTILKRDDVDLLVLATLGYDNAGEELFVQQYKLASRTSSGLFNTSLEVLANKVAYGQIIKKARVNLKEIIAQELTKANIMLEKGLELKGVNLTGSVNTVHVRDITPHSGKISLLLELQGNLEADIFDLASLMPPK